MEVLAKVSRPTARWFLFGLSWLLVIALVSQGLSIPGMDGPRQRSGRVVYLGGQLSETALIQLGAAVAAQPGALLLLDSPANTEYLRHFLTAYRPEKVVPIGTFSQDAAGLSERLGVAVAPILHWPAPSNGTCPLWQQAIRPPVSVIVTPSRPRSLLLRAAHLAAVEGGALWLMAKEANTDRLRAFVRKHRIARIVAVAEALSESAPRQADEQPSLQPTLRLSNAAEVETAALRTLGQTTHAVLVNPSDAAMAPLGPWLAGTQRAALLLTNTTGTDVPQVVRRAERKRALRQLDTLTLLADLKSIPVWQRPNPIPGDKDVVIDLEPLTPVAEDPFSYAIGRLFHTDRAVVPLQLARGRLLDEQPGPLRALVASNPGGGLNLLETLSRNTATELRHASLQVTELFGKELTGPVLRRQMTQHQLILWEGHHNTLVKDWGFVNWKEPLPPSLVILQSCLALQPEKMEPLLARGALGVVGTSTRTYSGSGGAFSLAYCNALFYEGQSLGRALRSSKNFLVAWTLLKQKRLGDAAVRLGANQRAAWAFSLWGDPTYQLPHRQCGYGLGRVDATLQGNTLVVKLPPQNHDPVGTDRYTAQLPPGGRLAGLLRKLKPPAEDLPQALVPLVFAEVPLGKGKGTGRPRLRSSLPDNAWVFLWDARRRSGYLLLVPPSGRLARADGRGELRFRIDWPEQSAAQVASEDGTTPVRPM